MTWRLRYGDRRQSGRDREGERVAMRQGLFLEVKEEGRCSWSSDIDSGMKGSRKIGMEGGRVRNRRGTGGRRGRYTMGGRGIGGGRE